MADQSGNDPFVSLRLPDAPIAPNRAFATDLRRRVETALGSTQGGTTMPRTQTKPPYQPAAYHSVVTYIAVGDFQAAREFYEQALGGRLTYEPIIMDDGRVGHAEMTFGDTVVMISEEFPELGVLSATSLGGSPVMLTFYVEDADAMWQRAVDAGATPLRPVELQFYGARSGQFLDPFGLRWSVSTQVEEEEGSGDA
jgi:PhnB protein